MSGRTEACLGLILAALLWLPTLALGEDDELLLFQELPQLTSASRHVVSLVESPATASVLSQEDIAHSSVQNIPELLRFVSGITLAMPHSSAINVGMRGVNGQQASNVLVLVDGRPIYSPVRNTNQCLLIPETQEDIERIEVIRGPGSVLYGSHAFAGVINIITKRPEDINGVSASAIYGTYNIAKYSVTAGKKLDSFSYKLLASWEKTGDWADHEDLTRDLFKLSGELLLPLSNGGTLDLSWGGTNGQLEIWPSAYIKVDQDGFDGFVRSKYATSSLLVDVWWRRHVSKGFWAGPLLKWQFDNVSLTIQRDLHFGLHDMVYGMETRWAKIRSNSYDSRHQQFLYSLFMEDRWRLAKDLDLFMGFRMDHHPLAHEAYSPRVSLVKMLGPNQSLRVSAAQAFKNPSYLQNYLDIETPFLVQLGNRGLEQEKIQSLEAAYQIWNPSGISLLTSLFFNRYLDVIDMRLEEQDGVAVLTSDNAYDGYQYGLEVDFSWRPSASCLMSLNYSYIWKERVEDATFGPVPTHQLNGELRYDWPSGYWVDARAHWQDRSDYSWGFASVANVLFPGTSDVFTAGWHQTEAYTYVDLSMGYRPLHRRWELSGVIHNLFHDTHKECPLGEEIPTIVTLRFLYNF